MYYNIVFFKVNCMITDYSFRLSEKVNSARKLKFHTED